jgi:hypothetical protein
MILKGEQLGFTLTEIHDILAGSGEEYGKAELEVELTAGQIAAQISQFDQQRGSSSCLPPRSLCRPDAPLGSFAPCVIRR